MQLIFASSRHVECVILFRAFENQMNLQQMRWWRLLCRRATLGHGSCFFSSPKSRHAFPHRSISRAGDRHDITENLIGCACYPAWLIMSQSHRLTGSSRCRHCLSIEMLLPGLTLRFKYDLIKLSECGLMISSIPACWWSHRKRRSG